MKDNFDKFDSARRFKGKRGKIDIVTYSDGEEVERFEDVHGAFLVTIEQHNDHLHSQAALMGPEDTVADVVFAAMGAVAESLERVPKHLQEEVMTKMRDHILESNPELKEPLEKAFPSAMKSKKKPHAGLNLKVVEDTDKPKRTSSPSVSDFLYREED